MTEEKKTCTRAGCGKALRSNNTKGVCGSGCLSSEAPPAKRANRYAEAEERGGGDRPTPPTPPRPGALVPAGGQESVERFRLVAGALGLDPNQVLGQFADAWLAGLRNRIEQ